MDNPAAFKATFSDFKLIKGRKCAQIILEVPIEAADAALEALGGVPRPDRETWAAVARIDPKGATEQPKGDAAPPKERRPFSSLPLSQQAALRCNDKDFANFLREYLDYARVEIPEGTANIVRDYCLVKSRADIQPGTRAEKLWLELLAHYEEWQQRPTF